MAISQYSELKTAVAAWLDRTNLTAKIPDFITIAEGAISRDVRVRQMEKRVTADLSTEYIDIPTDLLEMKNIQLNTDPIVRLEYMTAQQMDMFNPSSTTGKPKVFAILGKEFQFKPVPGTTYTAEISYLARFAAMSADSDTNWLLTNHPEIYLYASLVVAADYLRDKELISEYANLYTNSVDTLNDQDNNSRTSGALLRMRSDTGDP